MPDYSIPRFLFCLMTGLACAGFVSAQNEPRDESDQPSAAETRWNGQWSAEGLAFVVQARTSADHLDVSPVEPAEQGWITRNGRIRNDTATIEVEYQGVTATALIQLMADDTAIARALSCQPDYHVICTLVRNQQARFHRLPASTGE
ncbi:MAG: hypothetical protein WEB57_08905 [Pseudohongiellaceae bacterium]